MGSSSKSSTTNRNEAYNFNNIDYGSDEPESGSGIAKNINLARSNLETGDITSTDHGAVSGALELADTAARKNAEVSMSLGDRAYDDVSDSRELTRDLFSTGVDSVNAANRETLQYLNQNTDRALAFATKATRSEGGQIAENLTQYMMVGGAGIVVLVIFMNRKG